MIMLTSFQWLMRAMLHCQTALVLKMVHPHGKLAVLTSRTLNLSCESGKQSVQTACCRALFLPTGQHDQSLKVYYAGSRPGDWQDALESYAGEFSEHVRQRSRAETGRQASGSVSLLPAESSQSMDGSASGAATQTDTTSSHKKPNGEARTAGEMSVRFCSLAVQERTADT